MSACWPSIAIPWAKHEQIFKRNYRFLNNNEFKIEINQID